jgi:ATP-dependent DNA helicase RecQ
VNQTDLYNFEVANPKYEILIKTLLRSYSGLFDGLVDFNEYLIAKRLKIDVKDLLKQLRYLDKIELIEYLPANDKPQITFLMERLPEDRIRINFESYGALKERQLIRCDAMIAFLEKEECRNIQLLHYFGEKEAKECGKCDVCIRKNKGDKSQNEMALKVKGLIQNGKNTLEQILKEVAVKDEKEVIAILRFYADEGLILKQKDQSWKWQE